MTKVSGGSFLASARFIIFGVGLQDLLQSHLRLLFPLRAFPVSLIITQGKHCFSVGVRKGRIADAVFAEMLRKILI